MKSSFKHVLLAGLLFAGINSFAQPAKPEKVADGVIVPVGDTFLKAEVWGDNIIRIVCAKDRAFFSRSTPATQVRQKQESKWDLATSGDETVLQTSDLAVHINLTTGAVSFFDAAGRRILAEKTGGRILAPADVQGEKTFHVAQQWEPNADESLYGLGQLQFGITDIKGYDLDLWQHNTCVVVPLLVSSRGYGVFWDNLSFTRFGDLREWGPVSRRMPVMTPPAIPAA